MDQQEHLSRHPRHAHRPRRSPVPTRPGCRAQHRRSHLPGKPATSRTFIAYGVAREPNKPTTFTGLVLDNTSQPIGGALCRLYYPDAQGNNTALFSTTSDLQGRFAFTNALPGPSDLNIVGLFATTLGGSNIAGNSFPALSYPVTIIPNAENSRPMPVLLPRLHLANQRLYYGTNHIILTCEGIEGLKMTIKSASMKDPRGNPVNSVNPVQVSLNQVHHDSVPMPIPDGASPPFAWTLQPGGSTFDPPIQIEYPNMSGLPAGSIAYFLSYNHDTERFEIISSAHVTSDSSRILSDPGAGLSIAGWGCNCPPYSVTGDAEECEQPAFAPAGGSSPDFSFPPAPPMHGQAMTCDEIIDFGGVGTTDMLAQDTWLTTFCDCDPNHDGEKTRARIQIMMSIVDTWYWASITDTDDQAFVINHELTHEKYAREFYEEVVAAAQQINNHSYPDEEECQEALANFKRFNWSPALQQLNGRHDLLDARDKARDRGIKNGICSQPPLRLVADNGEDEPYNDVHYRPGESRWQVTLGGQTRVLDFEPHCNVHSEPEWCSGFYT